MSIILGNGDVLKDLHIGNKKISKVVVGNKVVWQKPSGEWPGLKFTSKKDGSILGYTIHGSINKDIYYSTDGKTWISWDGSNITLDNGESIYVWNKTNTLNTSDSNRLYFRMPGGSISDSIEASGNINSMINFSELTPYCYYYLFSTCIYLTTAPDLPATTLAPYCYSGMFISCSKLTTAPELPATNLTDECYRDMFSGCTSLTTAPELPATTLANRCYEMMFNGCQSLTTAPDLPATNLASDCYYGMFRLCSSLNSIKLSYMGNFSSSYFGNWVYNISSSGILYYNGSDTKRGNSAIPTNFTVQTF